MLWAINFGGTPGMHFQPKLFGLPEVGAEIGPFAGIQ